MNQKQQSNNSAQDNSPKFLELPKEQQMRNLVAYREKYGNDNLFYDCIIEYGLVDLFVSDRSYRP